MTGSPGDGKALRGQQTWAQPLGWPLSHQVCWVVSELVWVGMLWVRSEPVRTGSELRTRPWFSPSLVWFRHGSWAVRFWFSTLLGFSKLQFEPNQTAKPLNRL